MDLRIGNLEQTLFASGAAGVRAPASPQSGAESALPGQSTPVFALNQTEETERSLAAPVVTAFGPTLSADAISTLQQAEGVGFQSPQDAATSLTQGQDTADPLAPPSPGGSEGPNPQGPNLQGQEAAQGPFAGLIPPTFRPQDGEPLRPEDVETADLDAEQEAPVEEEDETGGDGLTPEEEALVRELQQRDAEVRRHEQAHAAAGGQYAGPPTYDYQRGPDGRLYAVGGEVSIDTSPVPNDAEATIAKLQQVRRAALAPLEPSPQDQRVAAQAQQQINAARAELRDERLAEQADSVERPDRPRPVDEGDGATEPTGVEPVRGDAQQVLPVGPSDVSIQVSGANDAPIDISNFTNVVASLAEPLRSETASLAIQSTLAFQQTQSLTLQEPNSRAYF